MQDDWNRIHLGKVYGSLLSFNFDCFINEYVIFSRQRKKLVVYDLKLFQSVYISNENAFECDIFLKIYERLSTCVTKVSSWFIGVIKNLLKNPKGEKVHV